MAQSKYPNQIDTSVEIPTVRDNITEIGSDVLNSFKSAILQIEKTLGINPQGAVGNTLASRLNNSLDQNGNILPEAFVQAGLLYGPISNNEVSDVAAISESKLNLTFPTQLLQDEISMLQADLDSFQQTLNELSSKISLHINQSAINRHKALSISISASDVEVSDNATLQLQDGSVQSAFEEIYNSHINYSGENISSENNSHFAQQIFFDNTDVQSLINSSSVQGAIEDIANISEVGLVESNLNLNSNGLIRRGKVVDSFENNDFGTILVSSTPVTYIDANGSSRTIFNFTDSPTPISDISLYDILQLYGSINEDDNIAYQIADFTLSSGDLVSVTVFGGPKSESTSGLTAIIYSNQYKVYNPAGLVGTVRPREFATNTPDIQILNPASATIITSGLNADAITSSTNTFNISIDGGTDLTIETYDSNVSTQSIDSIVNKINEQSVDQRLNILAYKYRADNCYELAIAHNIPNIVGDIVNRTLNISAGSIDDGTTELGLSSILGIDVEGSGGNSILINGRLKNIFGNIQTFTSSDIGLVSGSSSVQLLNTMAMSLGIRKGDLLIVDAATDSADNGSYRISAISDDIISLDTTYSFSDVLGDSGVVYILRNSALIDEMTFEEVGASTGSIIFDVFMNDSLDIFWSKRLEIDGETRSGAFIATIFDVSKNFIVSGEIASLAISTAGIATFTDPNLNVGDPVDVSAAGDYILYSADKLSYIKLRVGTNVLPSSPISVQIYGFNESAKSNYSICRGVFSSTIGRVIGYPSESGVPALIDRRITGTIGETNISSSFIEKYIEGPRSELRGSGILRGMEIANVQLLGSYQTFDVSAGIALVNGIRKEYPGAINLRINTTNNFYIAMDHYGCIQAQEAISTPDGLTIDNATTASPFYNKNYAHLAFVESQEIIDLRYIINEIDYKISKQLIVSNDSSLGHFTELSTAVKYAKRFSELYPYAGTPNIYIREGLYEINSPIIIDFDLIVSGSGQTTVIRKSGSLAQGTEPISGNPDPLSCVFYIGNTTNNSTNDIIRGVTIENMVYESSDSLTNVGSFITLSEARDFNNRMFRFNKLFCYGPSTIDYGAGVDADQIGEYAIIVGFADTSTFTPAAGIYGSIIISECVFVQMGLEYGPCLLRDAALMFYSTIIASNNIGLNLSPNEADTSFEVFEATTSAIISRMLEVDNITEI